MAEEKKTGQAYRVTYKFAPEEARRKLKEIMLSWMKQQKNDYEKIFKTSDFIKAFGLEGIHDNRKLIQTLMLQLQDENEVIVTTTGEGAGKRYQYRLAEGGQCG